MSEYDDYDNPMADKEWARKYILDPLTCPEPSEECGPGTSFRSSYEPQRSLSVRPKHPSGSRHSNALPTPPSSASPTRSTFQHTPPSTQVTVPASHSGSRSRVAQGGSGQHFPLLRKVSDGSRSVKGRSEATRRHGAARVRDRSRTIHATGSSQTNWSQGTIFARSDNASSTHTRDGQQAVMSQPSAENKAAAASTASTASGLHRAGSLSARFPGDMSHRPLAMIKKQHRAADRAPHLHTPHRRQPSDTIDSLDMSGPVPVAYHHDGPFDAALASRNANASHAPLSALRDSNMEALKATPAENIQDSIIKHVPLQGTAVIPPGERDLSGRVMDYEEGADLMREPDAAGGAYKRWDFIPYRDDDYKGKGEPSFTIEEHLKDQKARLRRHADLGAADGPAYEMLPRNEEERRGGGARSRQRSVSNATEARGPGFSTDTDIYRSHSTGKKLAKGFRRRFGNLRMMD